LISEAREGKIGQVGSSAHILAKRKYRVASKALHIRNVVDAVVIRDRLLDVLRVWGNDLDPLGELACLGVERAAGPRLVLDPAQVLTHLPAVVALGAKCLAPATEMGWPAGR
jgi:hypothetical protein